MKRVAALAAAIVLAALAALHLVWTHSVWPLPTREAFARTVLGASSVARFPSPAATCVVAALLLVTALIALARAGLARWPLPAWTLRLGAWISGGVLTLRGLTGLAQAILAPQRTTHEFTLWSGWLYSPLALGLGLVLLFNRRRCPASSRGPAPRAARARCPRAAADSRGSSRPPA